MAEGSLLCWEGLEKQSQKSLGPQLQCQACFLIVYPKNLDFAEKE